MRVSRLRVGFQILLHVVLIGHVVAYYWWQWTDIGAIDFQAFFHHFMGKGVLTAGALFTAVAFASAFVFGRLFCSWGCHFGATQDLAAWVMRKFGWKPPHVRTRILRFVPYAVLIGVFLVPAVAHWRGSDWGPFEIDFAAVAPWETLPGWFLSVVTFLACGAAILLFLGTRGFCRFVCPYGAVFRLSDLTALFRVRRTGDCSSSCGSSGVHPCTAACPTAIDVHTETSTRGKVTSSDCVRCHLCIESCPSGALSYTSSYTSTGASPTQPRSASSVSSPPVSTASSGFRPLNVPVMAAVATGPSASSRSTLPLWGELLVLTVGVLTYLVCDLVYGGHFLAATIGFGEGFLVLTALRAVRGDEGASILGRPLRRGTSWTFLGITAVGGLVLTIFPLFDAGAFKWFRYTALRLDPSAVEAGAPPGFPERPLSMPSSAEETQRLREAARCYEQALRYRPGHIETRRLLVSAFVRLGDRGRALKAVEELQRRAESGDELTRDTILWVYRHFGAAEDPEGLK